MVISEMILALPPLACRILDNLPVVVPIKRLDQEGHTVYQHGVHVGVKGILGWVDDSYVCSLMKAASVKFLIRKSECRARRRSILSTTTSPSWSSITRMQTLILLGSWALNLNHTGSAFIPFFPFYEGDQYSFLKLELFVRISVDVLATTLYL